MVPGIATHPSRRIRAYAVDFIVNQRASLTEEAKSAARILFDDSDPEVRAYAREMFKKTGII